MDTELENEIYTKNKQCLESFIKKQVEPYRHFEYDHSKRMKVCKHFLMGRCYRDDLCDYAHEIVPSKMPDCKFYEDCTDYFCHFKHRDDTQINMGCADFNRGIEFAECKCRKRGMVRRMCPLYAAGFCPNGPNCENAHPRWDQAINRAEINSQSIAPCEICGEFHLAPALGSDNCDKDKWVDNSCSVIYKCRGEQSSRRVPRRPQLFNVSSRRIMELLEEVIREIRQDEWLQEQKNRKNRQ